jgi:hypothetical protein
VLFWGGCTIRKELNSVQTAENELIFEGVGMALNGFEWMAEIGKY